MTAPWRDEDSSEEDMTGELHVRDDRRVWPVVASVGSSVLSAVLAVALCLTVQHRGAQRDREAQQKLAAVQEEQRRALCTFIIGLDDNYRTLPSISELGVANAKEIKEQRIIQGCAPRE